MSVRPVVTQLPSPPPLPPPLMITPLLNVKPKATMTKPSPSRLTHTIFSCVAQVPLFSHTQNPHGRLSQTVASYCSSKRKAKPKVASHSEGREDSSNINTTYLALSAPQSFWSIHRLILQRSQCVLMKKNSSLDIQKGML